MLFIREYDTKSLDRSSVSMIDKYNVRLNRVGELLDMLSTLINNLLSLIRDIRNILGQSKQRIYDNLDQVKEVIEGNGITGTDSTVDAIEGALEAGDKAIDEAEATLEDVGRAIECSEEYCDDTITDVECGETCNETPSETDNDDCSYCSFTATTIDCGNEASCSVCSQDGCVVDINCSEETNIPGDTIDVIGGGGGCSYSVTTDSTCNEATSYDAGCDEMNCNHSGDASSADGCNFACAHSSGCYESGMPTDCTYTCIDSGCAYSGDDCSYSSTCGQADSCNQSDCGQYDCGEPCGETCHMTTDDDGDCSETSCGECSDDLSDDDYYGGDDSGSDMCGEDCGDSCGL